ncbi:hypothetical protein AJ78_05963 [Emergomyces pasteurianus Ep9510]|uniref:J domain-containing protein n=1 Tax=Emergomyces pasteurianus Ep9510 TaxID=1447872 RepID=A0A1J9PC90_9EURO|nr:hypothetical protein AJ78_05963 [Emergomyces pasteurianus Ep9510]
MSPVPNTEDYYMVVEVEHTATPELITRSYKRLALKLHPDRNAKPDATEAFQLLSRAYETLKGENKRRAYDAIYSSITQTPRRPTASTPQSEALSEAAQIATLQKSKQERAARWQIKKRAFDSSIFELRRDIWQLEQEISNLYSILAVEAAAEEARKNSWGTWLSSIYRKAKVSEEEKARKDRERQERRIEKDMKERRRELKKDNLVREESLLIKAQEEVDAADLVENRKIRVIQHRILAREKMEERRKGEGGEK